ncbi:MAG: ABC transporter ATP-binding protein [Spirochaetota bacterium]|nr:ABC transporter ATP-binding protein [Spirochaetota bacterium]
MLKIRNLQSGYGNLRVLKGISMHINPGEIVAIIGANGAGKTTLLNTLCGIIPLQSGEIIFNNNNISNTSAEKIVQKGCSLVPEGRQIFDILTVKENLLLGAYTLRKKLNHSSYDYKKILRNEIEKIYSLFPVLKEREDQLGGTLSGGEQQMLAIGRAMMARPDLIMLDEPSMGLAPVIVNDIFKTIIQLREQGKTILLVEQNAKAALNIADRGYVIETGQIVLEESSEGLLNNNDVQRAYLGKDYKSIDEL